MVSSWLLLYVFTKAKHKTHEMITQTQKDDPSCFDDAMQLQALPDIAHSGLSAVAVDVKKQQTANSTEYVCIHPVCSYSVSVVTRAHNARSYDVDHVCMKSKPVDVNVPVATFNRCCKHTDFTNSNDSKAVVFELFSTKLIEIGLHCVHTSLIFNEAFKKQNPVFRYPISGYTAHSDIKGRSPDPISPRRTRRKGVWLHETTSG